MRFLQKRFLGRLALIIFTILLMVLLIVINPRFVHFLFVLDAGAHRERFDSMVATSFRPWTRD